MKNLPFDVSKALGSIPTTKLVDSNCESSSERKEVFVDNTDD